MKQGEKYDEKRVKEQHRDHALFIAFAPAEDPKIAIALLVENGGHGGSTAAPIAREVFDYHLLKKQARRRSRSSATRSRRSDRPPLQHRLAAHRRPADGRAHARHRARRSR